MSVDEDSRRALAHITGRTAQDKFAAPVYDWSEERWAAAIAPLIHEDRSARVAVLGPANYVRDDEPHALAFKIEEHVFSFNEKPFNVGRVADVEEDGTTMEDVLAAGKSEQDRKRGRQREAVLAVLTKDPQTVRKVASASGVPKSTTQTLLEGLEDDGLAVQSEEGWSCTDEDAGDE